MIKDTIAMKDNISDEIWRKTSLGDICNIIPGQSPSSDTYRKEPAGLPFFQGKADFGLINPVPRTWCVSPIIIALPGDILISVRAPVGPTNIANVECCIGRGLAAIRGKENICIDFIHSALKFCENKLASLGSGSTFSSISMKQLASLEIYLPSFAEQKRIAVILKEQLAAVEKARKAAKEKLEVIEQLPMALLRKAFCENLK
ncbi:MAG: hypothetical protein A2314_01070 [Elusimicrobia bacterium RIFOXYB2_FULL_50_12]|nr:MAG: hypothetical protein A2314_01070 [Elusimicrobia bacterium RIFOXYB2_FULL_50_12]